jgi:hypothetical protein
MGNGTARSPRDNRDYLIWLNEENALKTVEDHDCAIESRAMLS